MPGMLMRSIDHIKGPAKGIRLRNVARQPMSDPPDGSLAGGGDLRRRGACTLEPN